MTKQRCVIAVVESDIDAREAIEALLWDAGYQVDPFASGAEFLAGVTATEARCLVVNVQLSDISGIELARRLEAEGHKFPLIFLTTSADQFLRRQVTELGCAAYVHTTFLAGQLIEEIERVLGQRK